jgi:hypothetical protein
MHNADRHHLAISGSVCTARRRAVHRALIAAIICSA